MSPVARRCLMLFCLPLLLSACGDTAADWEAGGLYSVWEGETSFGVVKILAVDPEAISIRWFGQTFPTRPAAATSSELAAAEDEAEGLGFGHLPLPRRDFELMYPIRIGREDVTDAELEGYRFWRESGGEPVSFEDLAAMSEELDGTVMEVDDFLEAIDDGEATDE